MTAQLRQGTENPLLGLDLVGAGDVVIDVGAHIGTAAIPFANRGAHVVAIEPLPETFRVLQRNVERNAADVECVHALVSDAPVTMRATTTPGNTQRTFFEPGESDLRTIVLDESHQGPVSLLKIDVEGMELQVLRSARALIETYRPAVVLEVNRLHLRRAGTPVAGIDRFLRERGYLLHVDIGGRLGRLRSLRLLALGGDSLRNVDVLAVHGSRPRLDAAPAQAVAAFIARARWRSLRRAARRQLARRSL